MLILPCFGRSVQDFSQYYLLCLMNITLSLFDVYFYMSHLNPFFRGHSVAVTHRLVYFPCNCSSLWDLSPRGLLRLLWHRRSRHHLNPVYVLVCFYLYLDVLLQQHESTVRFGAHCVPRARIYSPFSHFPFITLPYQRRGSNNATLFRRCNITGNKNINAQYTYSNVSLNTRYILVIVRSHFSTSFLASFRNPTLRHKTYLLMLCVSLHCPFPGPNKLPDFFSHFFFALYAVYMGTKRLAAKLSTIFLIFLLLLYES